MTTRVLVLCTGNSCRSQMAEGWIRHLAAIKGEDVEVCSAGIEAHGLNPIAVTVMREDGIDISDQESNTLDEFSLDNFDLLVTVCGDADERCPVLPPGLSKRHWPLADPAKLEGTEQEVLQGFRLVRDEIRALVAELLG